jgi:ubiquinone/menaquinone biosynthesis C-methylase UbiE
LSSPNAAPSVPAAIDRGQRASLVADIGAGTGYFSVRIAKRIPEGKIFAADIEPDMVRYLGERARRGHLNNLLPVQASSDAALGNTA